MSNIRPSGHHSEAKIMVDIVDARKLPCPQPALLTRAALQDNPFVTTIVDNEAALTNVTRMAQKAGGTVHVEEREDGIYLHISKGALPDEEELLEPLPGFAREPIVLLVPGETMGHGEHVELGEILLRGFFHILGEVRPLPSTIIFLNAGVKLVVEGASVLEDLQALAERGISILVCGTCLGYYGLKEKLAVGDVSNMYEIAETLLRARKVVTL